MNSDVKLNFNDRFLPIQSVHLSAFNGEESLAIQRMYKTISDVSGLMTPVNHFNITQSHMYSQEEMGSSPIQLQFLQSQILLKNAMQILEIGTFIGVATMYMAEVMTQGKITTIEKFPHFADIARENFKKNNFDNEIDLLVGDAFEVIDKYEDTLFDFVYLDGDKERYVDYFFKLDPLVQVGGVFIVDDVFFHGDVFNSDNLSSKGKGVLNFLNYVKTVNHYHKTLLPIGNGLLIMIKQAQEINEKIQKF